MVSLKGPYALNPKTAGACKPVSKEEAALWAKVAGGGREVTV